MLFGIDVSEYQGDFNFAKAQSEGYEFAWIKSSGSMHSEKGSLYQDLFFDENVSKLNDPNITMIKGAYHYLMPEYPRTQAALLYERCRGAGDKWMAALDVEHTSLTTADVEAAVRSWMLLTTQPLFINTRANIWNRFPGLNLSAYGTGAFPLWSAHYVPNEVKTNPETPYGSQQYHSVQEAWWDGYGGWDKASILQISDHALVADHWIDVNVCRMTKVHLAYVGGVVQ